MTDPHEVWPSPPGGQARAARFQALTPALETPRLRLRAPRLSDFAVYAEIVAAPEGRFLLASPTRENAWYDFANMTACWLLRGHGLWSVERKAPEHVGPVVGFALIGFEPGDHEPELGYMTAPSARGRGYAAEAAGCALRYAFDQLDLPTLVSSIDVDNHASARVAEKLGGVRDRTAERAHDDAVLIFRYRR